MPSVLGNVTLQGFPVTSCILPSKSYALTYVKHYYVSTTPRMKNCHCYINEYQINKECEFTINDTKIKVFYVSLQRSKVSNIHGKLVEYKSARSFNDMWTKILFFCTRAQTTSKAQPLFSQLMHDTSDIKKKLVINLKCIYLGSSVFMGKLFISE